MATKPKNGKSSPAPDEARREAQSAPAPSVPATLQSAPTGLVRAPEFAPMEEYVEGSSIEDARRGLEKMRPEDITRPWLKLIQGISPELQAYDDLRAGHFFHSGEKANLGPSFVGVPLYYDMRYILWRPRDVDGGGILARADDGVHWDPPDTSFEIQLSPRDGGNKVVWRTAKTVRESGLNDFGTFNPAMNRQGKLTAPAATLQYNFLIIFPERPDLSPAVLVFQRSATKAGQDFNALINGQANRGYPMYQCAYKFSSKIVTNKVGQQFQNIETIGFGRLRKGDPTLDAYKALFDVYQGKRIKLDDAADMQEQGAVIEGEATQREGAPAY